jgi:hypothetical protein
MLGASAKSPDVSDNIRNSLDQAGFKNISVKEDRDKGVVTLFWRLLRFLPHASSLLVKSQFSATGC